MKNLFFILLGLGIGIIGTVALHDDLQLFADMGGMEQISARLKLNKVKTNTGSWMQTTDQLYAKFDTVFGLLSKYYYDKQHIDQKKMLENALKGYVDALGDPFTTYLTTDESKMFNEEMQGSQEFEGIGAVVTKKSDGIMIEEVIKDSPSYKADLKALDMILEINGSGTQSLWLQEAVQKIRGPKQTIVVLKIFRASEKKIFDVSVTREKITVPSVKAEEITYSGKNLLKLDILIIGDDTKKLLRQILTQHDSKNVDGVILDLRGNGGGYLPVSVDVASFFIPKGKVVVSSKYTVFPEEIFTSFGYGDLEGKPVVVLMDAMTASASEIIALALKNSIGAKLVGTKTFGKGSIQTVQQMSEGGLLKYTIGKRYPSTGANVDKVGIMPDVEVNMDREIKIASGDIQLEVARQELFKMIK